MKDTLSLWVGGAAGDGIAAAGEALLKTFSRSGLHAYSYTSYQSVIRGGHVLLQMAAGSSKRLCVPDFPDLLVALNQDSLDREAKDASLGILYDKGRFTLPRQGLKPGCRDLGLPVSELAKEPLMQNSVAVGAAVRLAGLGFETLSALLQETFRGKSPEVREANLAAAKAGYDHAGKAFGSLGVRLPSGGPRRMVMSGNQAIALGALAAGCRFYSAYPMTPASSIMHWFAPRASRYGLVFKQAEDEIAAVNMAIGAAHAGARAMTATSGGGFALMSEAVGLAGMTETPLVIVEVQRGGPSTGLPTKTEQSDLFQVLGASQGDYPKAVLAPATVEEAFAFAALSFNIAEECQMPVLLVSDLNLSEHHETVGGLSLQVPITRGPYAAPGEDFRRYAVTDSGVSPRAVPGQKGLEFTACSDEHDERGDTISDVRCDPVQRTRMMDKRMRKLRTAAAMLPPTALEGPQDAELTLVCWGSTYPLLRHLMERLNEGGRERVNLLCLRSLWPFPWREVSDILYSSKKTLAVEGSAGAQLCRLIRQETGYYIPHRSLKYDGEPFYPGSTLAAIEAALGHG
ncbi:MAG: 2-oxoacid:acceptor oxidoreductase subunit alpha [Elusimicrobiota bacterium]